MTLERWEIDSGHSGIHFSVRHMVVAKVRGQFTRWSAALTGQDGDIARDDVERWIDVTSIATGFDQRDAQLSSEDFLDVARYAETTFKSTRSEKLGRDRLRVVGDLTLHGVTREVALDVEH